MFCRTSPWHDHSWASVPYNNGKYYDVKSPIITVMSLIQKSAYLLSHSATQIYVHQRWAFKHELFFFFSKDSLITSSLIKLEAFQRFPRHNKAFWFRQTFQVLQYISLYFCQPQTGVWPCQQRQRAESVSEELPQDLHRTLGCSDFKALELR